MERTEAALVVTTGNVNAELTPHVLLRRMFVEDGVSLIRKRPIASFLVEQEIGDRGLAADVRRGAMVRKLGRKQQYPDKVGFMSGCETHGISDADLVCRPGINKNCDRPDGHRFRPCVAGARLPSSSPLADGISDCTGSIYKNIPNVYILVKAGEQ
ncbi:hypothetical protein [Ancylobacter sp. IITR112]|uniref:hypothetical protein n=1 Tax=Ancylobacter sp. IITR112 TaxID=3138073 RepID=UPI00352AA5C4